MTKFEAILENEKKKLIKCFEGNLQLKNKGIISYSTFHSNYIFIQKKLGGMK